MMLPRWALGGKAPCSGAEHAWAGRSRLLGVGSGTWPEPAGNCEQMAAANATRMIALVNISGSARQRVVVSMADGDPTAAIRGVQNTVGASRTICRTR